MQYNGFPQAHNIIVIVGRNVLHTGGFQQQMVSGACIQQVGEDTIETLIDTEKRPLCKCFYYKFLIVVI